MDNNINYNKQWLIFCFLLSLSLAIIFYLILNSHNVIIHYDNWQSTTKYIHNIIGTNQLFHLLLGLLTIICISRLIHLILKFIYQPLVISEMIAGILIGPSFLGILSPELFQFIIPPTIIPAIQTISQMGIIIYMFIIGLEFDGSILKNNNNSIIAVAIASIIFPFIIGIGLAIWLLNHNLMLPTTTNVSFVGFALFMGVSISITAFPVLARILADQNMHKSTIGLLVLTCASFNDVIAWCLLALVISIVNSAIGNGITTILLTLLYITIMIFLIKPLAQSLSNYLIKYKYKDEQQITIVIISLITSALIAEYIGIHAIFGAFLLGIVIPKDNEVINNMSHKLKDLICIIFLPAFFAYIGIKTQFNSIDSINSWVLCGCIILLATIGKFGGTYFTARLFKMDIKKSTSLAILMNTRGLVELIVLNIGLELGIINQQLFTIMVIMAIFTTCMTGPALHLIKINSSPS